MKCITLTVCDSSDEVGPVDCTVELVVEFIRSQMSTDESTHRLRGPYLAQLELMRLLRDRHDDRWNVVFGQFCLTLLDSNFTLFFVLAASYSPYITSF